MAVLDTILEKAAEAAGHVLVKVIDYLQEKRDKRAEGLPPLTKPLPELSINAAVRKAQAEREQLKKSRGNNNGSAS